MPQPQYARTILTRDGRTQFHGPYDWPDNVREPYFDYAVTVLDPDALDHYLSIARTKRINWYGIKNHPYVEWL